ncbi:MAG: tryptophan synthase subunit alpha [Opitutales bacterium]|jgi:tryptophan synthase alpha chain|nr:tryptophan synthase subunit alpha [Opitutales bacterium]MDP4645415.1 tryptophan synthase subunit alpha [Opitutales bacterium]MDP4776401.1 tryptophan synthase subunit alpha [Opitutales bacterium]MDP4883632.1 tryptophan synthase subunit alpha [Opitutales bacterium]MDP5080205.1 tryptophan synthase subunit alpha [Opitutales bacterium]
MNRIEQAFAKARSENRAAFVAYLCAGDPDFDTSVAACRAILDAGVDVLELGVPFSDPLADGLTNQLAAQRALESGMTSERVLELVRAVRSFSDVPIVFYTYYNLVFAQGSEAYAERAKAAGVDGILTLDLPPEEAGEHLAACEKHGLGTVFIVAPTTPDERLGIICGATSGFVYYVSREGVTGEQAAMSDGIRASVETIKKHTDLPVVVGFGISNADHVQTVAQAADGVVVGSAIVNCIAENLGDPAAITAALSAKMAALTAGGALQKQ